VFRSKRAALTGIFQKLDKSVCEHCTARCFEECASVEFKGESRPLQPQLPRPDDRPEKPELEPGDGIPVRA